MRLIRALFSSSATHAFLSMLRQETEVRIPYRTGANQLGGKKPLNFKFEQAMLRALERHLNIL